MGKNKDYLIKVLVINIETDAVENTHLVNYSKERGRLFLDKLIFSCINTGKGVAIELDHIRPSKGY